MEFRLSYIVACCYNYFVIMIQLCSKGSKAYLNITIKYFSWIRVKLKKSHDLIELDKAISFKELKNNNKTKQLESRMGVTWTSKTM